MTSGFCIQGDNPLSQCKDFIFDEFPDEKGVIVLILEYFKTFLPQMFQKKDIKGRLIHTDYYNKPIIIDPKDIDLTVQKEPGSYVVVLSITDDDSSYPDEEFYQERTVYSFQIDLWVHADDSLGALENLIRLKSATKTLLVNMDRNLDLKTFIDGFSFGEFGIDESHNFVRQGTYRFSVEDTNFKQ